jgi:hypothetical protein
MTCAVAKPCPADPALTRWAPALAAAVTLHLVTAIPAADSGTSPA